MKKTDTSSSLSGSVIVFPIRTSSPDTLVPGEMIPSSSSLSYKACLIPTVNIHVPCKLHSV